MTTLETGTHPLAMTTEAEVCTVREVLVEAGLLTDTVRYTFFAPEEPHQGRGALRQRRRPPLPGRAARPRHRPLLGHRGLHRLPARSCPAARSTRAREGQPPIIDSEFEIVEDILNADQRWLDALAARDIKPEAVRAVPLSAGVYDEPDEVGRRMCRAIGFRQDHELDHPWAHPIDGLVAYIDLTTRSVTKVIDTGPIPVSDATGNYDDPEVQGPPLESLKPIEITQPEGRSFTVDGQPRPVGQVGPALRVQRAGRPDPAPDQLRRPPDRLPGQHRRDGGALRPADAGAVLAELLRLRRVHVRPVRRLARAGLRLPRRHPLHRRGHRRRLRQPEDDPQRHLHARGGLRRPLEALRPVHQRPGSAPPAAPGALVLHADRQLRLRLLLVPLPRRHHPARGEAHRDALRHRPGGRVRHRGRARARARPTTSTCSRPGST